MFDKQDVNKNEYMLKGKFSYQGYDWWWHNFTAINHETKEEKPFFIEFYICNPKVGGDEVILGKNGKNKPSYLMVKCGTWGKDAKQLHRFIPINQVKIKEKGSIKIESDDCYLDEHTLKGHVSVDSIRDGEMCDIGDMSFNLKINKINAYNVGYGTSKLFRDMHAFEMYWHLQGMKSKYEGEIIYNGVKYDVIPDKSYGYADKNWGCNFTSPWVWLSSWDMYSNKYHKQLDNSVFAIGGGCPKVFNISLPRKLLGAFIYEGQQHEFNFSKFWNNIKTTFDFEESEKECIWHVTQSNWKNIIEVEVKCQKEDMLKINYEDPLGYKKHNNLWNGGNGVGNIKFYKKKNHELIDDITIKHIGCEYGEFDR